MTDAAISREFAKLPPGRWGLIKEHQMWGPCLTARDLDRDKDAPGAVLYNDDGEWVDWETKKNQLREYWRPVAHNEREWFCDNLTEGGR